MAVAASEPASQDASELQERLQEELQGCSLVDLVQMMPFSTYWLYGACNWVQQKNDLLLFNDNEIRTSTCVATSVDAKPIYSFVRDRSAYMCELGLGLAIT